MWVELYFKGDKKISTRVCALYFIRSSKCGECISKKVYISLTYRTISIKEKKIISNVKMYDYLNLRHIDGDDPVECNA